MSVKHTLGPFADKRRQTFLSYLRLSVTMAVVSVAIALSFHLRHEPTPLELRMSQPLGIIFWVLSVAALAAGVGNYIKTVNKYSRKAAIVQTGWKTQSVRRSPFPSMSSLCRRLADRPDHGDYCSVHRWCMRHATCHKQAE